MRTVKNMKMAFFCMSVLAGGLLVASGCGPAYALLGGLAIASAAMWTESRLYGRRAR